MADIITPAIELPRAPLRRRPPPSDVASGSRAIRGADGDDDSPSERFPFRAAIRRFVVTGVVTLLIVAVPMISWVKEEAKRHALDNASAMTQRLADFAVAPLITEDLLAGEADAAKDIDVRVRPWFEQGPVMRIKVWAPDGRIVYSDDRDLIGKTFDLPSEAVALYAGRSAPATIEHQDDDENVAEERMSELVESYALTRSSTGEPLVFETYYRPEVVQRVEDELLTSMAPVFLGALVLLSAVQLIPAVGLARKVESLLAGRQRLLRRAIDASDFERKRIARDLHDEVIQDLAGLSYAIEAEERHGGVQDRPLLGQARTMLQRNIQTLRTMTRDLYPPDLEEAGLPAAVTRLADTLRERGVSVKLDVPESVDLSLEHAATLYRVAREALANVLKHADAQVVELSLIDQGGSIRLVIDDDGRGFDRTAGAPDGHFGLRVMQNTVREAGGVLLVRSEPGGGTRVEAVVGGIQLS